MNQIETVGEKQWFIAGRWQEYEGEARANLIRIIGITVFYVVELINYYGLHWGFLRLPQIPSVDHRFHSVMTALAIAWVTTGWCVHVALSRRVFSEKLKYLSSLADVILLTCILLVSDGPRSPLLVCYFLIISLSALRFSLPLIRMTTAGSMAGYLVLLGYARWYNSALRVPRYYEIIFFLALALCGVVLGQVIRRVRHFAEDFAVRLAQVKTSEGGA